MLPNAKKYDLMKHGKLGNCLPGYNVMHVMAACLQMSSVLRYVTVKMVCVCARPNCTAAVSQSRDASPTHWPRRRQTHAMCETTPAHTASGI